MAAGDGSMRFKEVVEQFAEQQGVPFLPKPGVRHNGKQVYSFGGACRIYLDQGVAFAEPARGGNSGGDAVDWEPVALEKLLERFNRHVKASSAGGSSRRRRGGGEGDGAAAATAAAAAGSAADLD